MAEVIITSFSNPTSEGVVLHTNVPARLKTGNVMGTSVWVSWDKIGEALFDNYTTMEFAIETLEIELHKWKGVQRNADLMISMEPQDYWVNVYNSSGEKIKELNKAIEILKPKQNR